VASGKGGVGKSCVATALAKLLHKRGFKVGLMDFDADSPSIPVLTGTLEKESSFSNLWVPHESGGVKVVSIGHVLPNQDQYVGWDGKTAEWITKEV